MFSKFSSETLAVISSQRTKLFLGIVESSARTDLSANEAAVFSNPLPLDKSDLTPSLTR